MTGRRLTFHLIPHTHWDREWYLPRAAFQARLVGATINLAALLEHDPAARFTLDGQTILLDDALEVRPDLAAPLDRAIAAGRLAVGPWLILADEQVPAGESLLRNLLIGTAVARQHGGRLDVLYSPDAFGHPGALPMLAREFGIAAGVLWRGLGGSEPGPDLYRWRSPSGDTILLLHLPPQGYEIGAALLDAGSQLATVWRAIRAVLVDRALTPQVAILLGADHHAPPGALSPLRDAMQELEPDHDVVISTLHDFFGAIGNRLTAPEIQGELRWSHGHTWTLQGVHGTRARMKRRHAQAELTLSRRTEPLTAMAQWTGRDDASSLLRRAWRTLIECQFHDTLGGCCSDLVADEQSVRLASVEAVTAELRRTALAALTGHDADRARIQPHRAVPTLVLWNPVPRPRAGITTATITFFRRDILVGPPSGRLPRTGPGFQPFVLTAEGVPLPTQLLSVERGLERLDAPRHYPDQDEVDRVTVAFDAPTMAGFAFATLRLDAPAAPAQSPGVEVSAERLANRFVELRLADDGTLDLTDRQSGEVFHDLLRLEDQPDQGDCYTVFVPDDPPIGRQAVPRTREVVASGPLLGAVLVRWTLTGVTGSMSCALRVELRADSPLIRLELDVDNDADDHRLRARIPIGAGEETIAGAAFGFEHRPAEAFEPADYPAERPVLTAPAHRYVAAASEARGLALLAPGFFEYEWTPRRDLLLTLVRSVGELSRGDLPTRPGHAGWPTATPGAQERGRHHLALALLPVTEASLLRPAVLEEAWEDAFLPVEATFVRDFTGRPGTDEAMSISLEGDGLVCSAIKPPEQGDGLVLRCVNVSDEPVTGAWIVATPLGAARTLRADESVVGPLAVQGNGRVEFTVPPRRISTILVTAAP